MEFFLRIFCWVAQIGITAGIALLLGWLLKQAESALRRKPGHLLPWTLCMFAVLCAVLAALALNPPVVCPDEYEEQMIFNSPAESKLRSMIAEATRLCEIENEKCRIRKAKLEAKKLEKRMMAEGA